MSYTRCQDRSCPMQFNCVRYDARYVEQPGECYFGKSPRSRDNCVYYHPFDHTQKAPAPLSSDWPKDPEDGGR